MLDSSGRPRRSAAREILQSHRISGGDLLVALNPGATYGPAKRWFADRFAQVHNRHGSATHVGDTAHPGLCQRHPGQLRHIQDLDHLTKLRYQVVLPDTVGDPCPLVCCIDLFLCHAVTATTAVLDRLQILNRMLVTHFNHPLTPQAPR